MNLSGFVTILLVLSVLLGLILTPLILLLGVFQYAHNKNDQLARKNGKYLVIYSGLEFLLLLLAAFMFFVLLRQSVYIYERPAFADALLVWIVGLVPVVIAVFFWGFLLYLIRAGEEKSAVFRIMFYEVIALFIVISIWAYLLGTTTRFTTTAPIIPKGIQINTGGT